MTHAIGEDHVALAETVRRFAADRIPPAVVRAAVDGADRALPPFWDELAGARLARPARPRGGRRRGLRPRRAGGRARGARPRRRAGPVPADGVGRRRARGRVDGGTTPSWLTSWPADRTVGAVDVSGPRWTARRRPSGDGAAGHRHAPARCCAVAQADVVRRAGRRRRRGALVRSRGRRRHRRPPSSRSTPPGRSAGSPSTTAMPARRSPSLTAATCDALGATLAAAEARRRSPAGASTPPPRTRRCASSSAGPSASSRA